MAEKALIKESLWLLNCNGVDPLRQNFAAKTRFLLTSAIYVYLIVEVLMELVLNWDGFNSLDTFAVFTGMYQVLSRLIVTALKRKKLSDLLAQLERFWPTEYYSDNRALLEEIRGLHRIVRVFYRSMIFSTAFLIAAFFLLPAALHIKVLPVKSYHPVDLSRSPNFEIAYAAELLTSCIATSFIVGYDTLFASFIVYVVGELKAIRHAFREKVDVERLRVLVEHHNLVLECIGRINGFYSGTFFNHFLGSTLNICFTLLAMILEGSALGTWQYFKFALYLLYFSGQLYIYCFQGSLLTAECYLVADAAYDSQWLEEYQPKFRNAVVLITQRAQKTELIMAGKLFPLNLESFTGIVNMAFSFFSVARATYQK